ncbi:MAG TPA: rRNA maturation RNase YbeY [Chitinophagaceae bacterium]|nr:rRNA maturation RNase YbeY [Chitinophagaceae bacterium]
MPSQTKSNIYFFFPAAVTLRDRTRLKEFILSIFKRENTKLASLNYIFCDDRQLLAINKQYLAHDFYTDIISFELSQPGQPVEGEIYISTDRVKDNAISLGETFKRELHRVIFHGALHLCGYRDKTKAEIEKMRAEENYYLDKYFKGKI